MIVSGTTWVSHHIVLTPTQQDASYLEYYYRVRTAAVAKSGSFEEITDFAAKLSSSLQYVTEARNDCTNKLGVPADDVAKEPKSQQLQDSLSLYEEVVKNGDWLECVPRVVS